MARKMLPPCLPPLSSLEHSLLLLQVCTPSACATAWSATTSRRPTRWCSSTSPRASPACASTSPTPRPSLRSATPASPSSSTSAGTKCSQTSLPAPPVGLLEDDRPVGYEVQGGATQNIVPAMQNLNAALSAAGLGAIKVSASIRFDAVANSFPPSAGVFAQSYMTDVARLLASTGAPLLTNVYPYFAYHGNPGSISLNYATFQPGTSVRDQNNGLTYTCLFDAMVDAVYAALEKAAAPGVKVVVSESGWPSAGGFAASADNARTYNQGLINHVGKGTPKKPSALETYIFAMFNENQKNGDPTEQHFGLFNPNKSPAYAITF